MIDEGWKWMWWSDVVPSVCWGITIAIFLRATDMQTHKGNWPQRTTVALPRWQLSLCTRRSHCFLACLLRLCPRLQRSWYCFVHHQFSARIILNSILITWWWFNFLTIRLWNCNRIQRHQNGAQGVLLRAEELDLFIQSNGDSVRSDTIEHWRCDEYSDGRVHSPRQRPISFQFHSRIV